MLDPLYRAVANGMEAIHSAISPVVGEKTFASWALSIVILVMGVRLLLVPAFVKSIKSQRQMALMQPKIAELRNKHKDDKQKLNEEMMKLQKEHGNPLLGCLPMLIQIPLFLSLFRVMSHIKPVSYNSKISDAAHQICPQGTATFCYQSAYGISAHVVQNIANAKAFGVSISAAFASPTKLLDFLGANGVAVKIVAAALIVLMTATTYITTLQSFRRNPTPTEPTQQQVQKLMLYLGPGFLFLFGFNFPIGVLLYWMTTNLWSLGQQHLIFKKMGPTPVPVAPGTVPTGPPPKKQLSESNPNVSNGSAAPGAGKKPASIKGRKSRSVGELPMNFGNVVGPDAPAYRQRTVSKKKKKR